MGLKANENQKAGREAVGFWAGFELRQEERRALRAQQDQGDGQQQVQVLPRVVEREREILFHAPDPVEYGITMGKEGFAGFLE